MFRPNAYVFLYTVEESLPLCVCQHVVFFTYTTQIVAMYLKY